MRKRKSHREKRSSALERRYLDRAILRLCSCFQITAWEVKLADQDVRELFGLIRARRRVP